MPLRTNLTSGPSRHTIRRLQRIFFGTALPALAISVLTAVVIWTMVSRGAVVVAQDIASNIEATVITIGLTFGLFWLRIRGSAIRRIVRRIQSQPLNLLRDEQIRSAPFLQRPWLASLLVKTITQSATNGAFIVGQPGTGRSVFLTSVARELASMRRVPIFLDATGLQRGQSLIDGAKNQLRLMLEDDDQAIQVDDRLWRALFRRRRLFILIDGLDAYYVSTSIEKRREAIAALLCELYGRRIPFIATLPSLLVTRFSDVALFHLPSLLPEQLESYLDRMLTMSQLSVRASSLTPPVRGLQNTNSVYMLDLSVRYALIKGRKDGSAVARLKTSYRETRRLMRELVWLTGIAQIDWMNATSERSRLPRAACLTKLGRTMLLLGLDTVLWQNVIGDISGKGRDLLFLGRMALERDGVLRVDDGPAGEIVSFDHPIWLGIAGGIGVDLNESQVWQTLLEASPTEPVLHALAIATVRESINNQEVILSIHKSLQLAGLDNAADINRLPILGAVMDGLLAVGYKSTTDRELADAIPSSWSMASTDDKIRFLTITDFGIQPEVALTLWQELVSPLVRRNSYRVRREIARRLAAAGDTTWRILSQQWESVCDAAFSGDLSSKSRTTAHAQQYVSAVAHLGWILPTLIDTCTDIWRPAADALCRKFAKAIMPPYDGYTDGAKTPDIGIEISYFEGIKLAAIRSWSEQTEMCDELRQLVVDTIDNARSWVSKIAIVQALALGGGPESKGRFAKVLQRYVSDGREHPFVRQAAWIAMEPSQSPSELREHILQTVWLDDSDVLLSGGSELSNWAHGLLAVSTLLINLAEERGWREEKGERVLAATGQEVREKIFVSRELPKCVASGAGSWLKEDAKCSCDLGMCGGQLSGLRGLRKESSTFLYRARETGRLSARFVTSGVVSRIMYSIRTKRLFMHLEKAIIENEGSMKSR